MIEIQENPLSPPQRNTQQAMLRGLAHTCPACGKGALYESYLKVVPACPVCGEALHHHRADDAPPYFTIFIVGHIVGLGILELELAYAPETWVHLTIWLPLLLILSLLLLPRIKGALVGLQWAQRMHGFGGIDEERAAAAAEAPAPAPPA